MQLAYLGFTAIVITSVHASSAAAQTCLSRSDLDLWWSEKHNPAVFTCSPVESPSGNRQQPFSGQRLNTYFAYWRSNQSIKTPLPIALVITFHSQSCLFSKALLPLMDEVAQQYSRQSIKFISVDTAHLAYADLIKMGITSVPVIRLHTQVKRLTYPGNRTLSAVTQYITNYTGITTVPQRASDQPASDIAQTGYTQAPMQVATASSEDMRGLATAPLTLLAELVVVLYLMEVMWRKHFMQSMRSWCQRRRRSST